MVAVIVSSLLVLLTNVQFSHSCDGEGQILICRNIPSYFSPSYLTLVMYLSDVGEINSTVFRSSNLSSVTRLRIDNAGVTGMAEGAFSSFQNLTSLSLNKNAVTQMNSNWFGQPAVLNELSLTENLIEAVNEFSFSGLINLTKLTLNKNRIRTIGPNSFSSQANLVELDLSENRMTRVSPQVFRSLRSPKIRLDGNPWDCSCKAKDSVDFLKDLWSRSLLDRKMEVTCESPVPLRGQPVWNVSVCATSPTPSPPSGTQTVHPEPTGALTTAPSSSARPTSETHTSVQAKPTESLTTATAQTATSAPSPPPSEAETSVLPRPTDMPIAISLHTEVTEPPSNTNTVCTLTVVIVVLCVLLFAVCLLAVLHRRKVNNKTVMPGCAKEEKNKPEEDSGSSPDEAPGHTEERDSEMAWRRPFAEVRAKSANAVLLSSFFVSGKDQVTSQNETEAQTKHTETQAVNEAARGNQTENVSNSTIETNEKQADAHGDMGEKPHCVSVNTETVPYLSIGANPDDPNKQSTDSPGQKPQMGKVMGRIATWPPTAIQWQARCKMKEVEENGSDAFMFWTQNEIFKFSGEVKKIVKKAEHPSGSDGVQTQDNTEKNPDLQTAPPTMNEAHKIWRHTELSNPNENTTSFSEIPTHTDMRLEEEQMIQDAAARRQTVRDTPKGNPAENPPHKPTSESSNKAGQRNEAKGAGTSRQRGENSKAPSGGASPDDETLLSGNEYAFMDLLHEVVQNNGRWTRERWKQIHINKQRR